MGKLTPQEAKEFRGQVEGRDGGNIFGTALRGMERVGRLGGLGAGTAAGAFLDWVPGLNKWTPNVYSSTPEAFQAFWNQASRGDWDAAIEAYQDEMEAGKGFWGAAEIAGAFLPTGAPALAGGRLISAAPKLAQTLGRVRGSGKAMPGVETGARWLGKGLRAPWEAEEAVGRAAIKGLGVGARSVLYPRTGPLAQAVGKLRPGRGVKAADDISVKDVTKADQILGPPTPPVTPVAQVGRKLPIPSAKKATTGRVRLFHGTPNAFEAFELGQSGSGMYGPGIYLTTDPGIAAGYALKGTSRYHGIVPDWINRSFMDRFGDTPVMEVKNIGGEKFVTISTGGWSERAKEIGLEFAREDGFQSLWRIPTSRPGLEAAPNIRAVTVRLKKVLDIDAPADKELLESLRGWGPVDEFNLSDEAVELLAGKVGNATNKDVYRLMLQMVDPSDPKMDVADRLAAMGYDGITHIGGGITGKTAHRVVIAIGDEFASIEKAIKPALSRLRGEAARGATAAPGAPEAVAAAGRVGRGGVRPPPGAPTPNPSASAGGPQPVRISGDITQGFAVDPKLSWWSKSVNLLNDVLEEYTGKKDLLTRHFRGRLARREVGVAGVVETVVRNKADVARQMIGHSSWLMSYIRRGKRVFGQFDEDGRILDDAFKNRSSDIGEDGTVYALVRPTIQDVAARLDEYRPFMTEDQLKFMERLRDIFENGTTWEEGGVIRTMPGWNALLRENMPRWNPNRVRPDVKGSGFYLSRGRAKPPGKFSKEGDNELLNSFTAKAAPKLNKRLIAQNRARSPSMSNAIDNKVVYDSIEDALVGHINDVATKVADINIGKQIKLTNRKLPKIRGREQMAKDIIPGGIPGLKFTHVDDALALAIKRELGKKKYKIDIPVVRNINQIYRGMKATADFSALGIHGAFAAWRNPLMWSKAAKISLKAMFAKDSVGVADELIRAADEAAMAKGLFTSDFWSSATLHIAGSGTEYGIPGLARLAKEGPIGVRQVAGSFERFNRSFGAFGDALRLDWANKLLEQELKKGRTLKELWDSGDVREMAKIANKLTGSSERAFGGDLGELLLFAPRYFQSRLETFAQALEGAGRIAVGRQQTIQSREALRTVVQMVGFGVSLTEIINAITDHETDRRPWVDGKPNPNFYTIRYGGRDFSLFGPSIGFVQAIANTVTGHPERAMRSLGSGVVRILWDNLKEGYTFMGEEAPLTRTEEGAWRIAPDRFMAYLGEMTLPIATTQAGGQLLDVGQQIPGAARQIMGEEVTAPPGLSPVERVAGGLVAVGVETVGGRVAPLSRTDWQNEIARSQYGKPYDDLTGEAQRIVDKMVTEQYGERSYRGAKGHLYEKKDQSDATLIGRSETIANKRLSGSPASEKYDPVQARYDFNDAKSQHRGRLYGVQWSEEKQRTIGGLLERMYDRDKEQEVPERGTKEYRLWLYGQTFTEATDSTTGKLDFDKLNKLQGKFWASLTRRQADEMLASIRLIEGDYDRRMQNLLDAGRYAGSFTMTLSGQSTRYYDLDQHKDVVSYIVGVTGENARTVQQYISMTGAERKAFRKTAQGESIGKAFDKAQRKNGVLWQLRQAFVTNAPNAWRQAMFEAGYSYQGKPDIQERVYAKMRAGTSLPRQNYKRLYRGALIGQ